MSAEKSTRFRRTKADIAEDIRQAAVAQVIERGFSSSLVTEIIRKARIEPRVFYNRYKDISEFYGQFVKEYDYWFSDIAENAMKSSDDPKTQFVNLMLGLQGTLKGKTIMQEILRWEITEGNETTNRMAMLREMFTLPLVKYYTVLFKNSDIDFVALGSLMIGGLYYLSLHKERSTFCGIDLTREEDIERVNKAIYCFAEVMFSFLEHRNRENEIVQRMRTKGIDEQTIRDCLWP